MEGVFRYRLNYHKMLGRKKSDGNYGSFDETGSVSVSIGLDSPSELEEIKKDLEALLVLDEYVAERMKDTSKYFIQIITDEEVVAEQPDTQKETKTSATLQAETPSSQAGPPNWTPKYPEVDAFLTTEGGFTHSKYPNSYAKVMPDQTIYVNRSKNDDKWNMKNAQGEWWNASWGVVYNSIMQKISELTPGDK